MTKYSIADRQNSRESGQLSMVVRIDTQKEKILDGRSAIEDSYALSLVWVQLMRAMGASLLTSLQTLLVQSRGGCS